MTGNYILTHTYCTILSNGISYEKQGVASIYDILTRPTDSYKSKVDELRALGYGTAEYKEMKKLYPCYIPSGIFKNRDVHDDAILQYSNIIAIDIDKNANPDIDMNKLKHDVFELPYVLAVSDSISGVGIYALIYVEDGRNTISYCKKLEITWNNKFNIICDASCKNLGRKRFISYDNNLLIKNDEEITPWKVLYVEPLPDINKQFKLHKPVKTYSNQISYDLILEHTINKLIDYGFQTNEYNTWLQIGFLLKPFDDLGYDMFLKISENSNSYSGLNSVQQKWNNIPNKNDKEAGYKYFFSLAKKMIGPNYFKEIIKDIQN